MPKKRCKVSDFLPNHKQKTPENSEIIFNFRCFFMSISEFRLFSKQNFIDFLGNHFLWVKPG